MCPGITIGLLCCFGFLPMLSFMLSLLLKLPPAQSIGLIMMSTCPGGAFASVAVYLFNADLPLSIAMTTASTILSFIFIVINSTLYIPIIANHHNLVIDYNVLIISVMINLMAIAFGLLVSYFRLKALQKVLGLAGLFVISSSTMYTVYNMVFGAALSGIVSSISFGGLVAPLVVELFSYLFGFGVTFFFNLPNEQIVSIALQCGNPNVYLSIAILYVTMQSAGPQQIDLALSMPILFTIYGTVTTIALGVFLHDRRFITVRKHKKLMKYFRKKKRRNGQQQILKSIDSSDEEMDDGDDGSILTPFGMLKRKFGRLMTMTGWQSAIQPEKIMEYLENDGDAEENAGQRRRNGSQVRQEIVEQCPRGFTIDSEDDCQ